ncbi:hypothetical protein CQW23_24817 [Capsicum baccatum]|uniref:Uncharacterized protein n=1 Tax=Capsicum baccatum TaxID=33114 RepID=A0A2G2VVW1_CAPBA|nr:hypothetical protein CQW23_24817 [Capsicum baccatum]
MKEIKVGSAQGYFFRVKTVNTLSNVHGQISSVEVNWTSKLLYLLVNIGLKDTGTQSDLEILERNTNNMLIPFGQYMEPLPIVVALRVLIRVYCLSNKMMHDVMILSKELFVIFFNEEENFYFMALNKSRSVYKNRGYTTWFDMKLSVPKTERVLMMHNFLPLLFDPGSTILKYHTIVEKTCKWPSYMVPRYSIRVGSELVNQKSSQNRNFRSRNIWFSRICKDLSYSNRVAVGLHIFLSNITSSASLRGGATRVSKVAIDSPLTFDPGGVLIGLKKGRELMKTICPLHDSRKTLKFLYQVIIELNRGVHSCQQKTYFPADIAITEWGKVFIGDTYSRSSLLQDIFRDNQLRCAYFGEQCLQCPFDPGRLSSAS